jgi:hypothetical protein
MPVHVVNHFVDPFDEDTDTFYYDDADSWSRHADGALDVIGSDGSEIASFANGAWSHVTHEARPLA